VPLSSRRGRSAACLALLLTTACVGSPGVGSPTPGATSPRPSASPPPDDAAQWVNGRTLFYAAKNDQPGFNEQVGYDTEGFEAELANTVATALGLKGAKAVNTPSKDRENFDGLVIATFSITNTRRKHIDFVGPYFRTDQALLLRKDDTSIKSRADAAGKTICTATGSTSSEESAQDYVNKDAKIKLEKSYSVCVKHLLGGLVDAVWTDEIILQGFASDHPDELKVELKGIGQSQEYGIGFPKGHPQACRRVRDALKGFMRNDWVTQFRNNFSDVAENVHDFQSKYGLDRSDANSTIDAESCQSG
jgi:glutamate transport system substrate-binding protein